ncbi:MAG: hypothetical protein ACRD1H_15595 [Vicinamibacterales bacterium]
MTALERAILQSVVYASVFDYPLTLAQLRDSLIGERADEHTLARCYATSVLLQAGIEHVDGFYFPRGRRDLLDTRQRREVASRRLLATLWRPLSLIATMPFVRMVALSGSLAHLNADDEADLDLFVITRPARVWSVTLTTLVLARLLGWRKRLCLNYVVSERALMVGPADLFCANQIVHLQPLTGSEAYMAFLDSNRFIERFYPNFRPRNGGRDFPVLSERQRVEGSPAFTMARATLEHLLDWTIAPLYERLCRFIYGRHLRRRAHTWQSRDQVRLEPECLKLHTSSHRREVMEKFERRLESVVQQAEAEVLTLSGSSPMRVAR